LSIAVVIFLYACECLWDYMERTEARGDAYASILSVKYMLEGQYVEICPLMDRHWDALECMYRQA